MAQARFFSSRIRHLPRTLVLLLAILMILGLGLLIRQLPGDWTLTTATKGAVLAQSAPVDQGRLQAKPPELFNTEDWRLQTQVDEQGQPFIEGAQTPRQQQIRVLFEHGTNLMRQRQYPQARKSLEMLLELAPKLPEAYVNLGFVLYEMGETASSVNAFNYAAQLNPYQSNAYYGAALGYERQSDYEAALGQMRSFIHLSQGDNPFLPKARAALWEWEQIIEQRRQVSASAAEPSIQEDPKVIRPRSVLEEMPNAQK